MADGKRQLVSMNNDGSNIHQVTPGKLNAGWMGYDR
jgi:hypothetical protein